VTVKAGSLFDGLPSRDSSDEAVEILCRKTAARIERIVSTGQTTPEDEWYDQAADEWVLLVEGGARLRIEGERQDRTLAPGDYLLLPAHCRHRVTWTEREPPTVWLAIHFALD